MTHCSYDKEFILLYKVNGSHDANPAGDSVKYYDKDRGFGGDIATSTAREESLSETVHISEIDIKESAAIFRA
jgi:hypothetical protein